jgi:predicted adenine nucleotide alpha hydrolase (AANH) superfamily ATPase
VDSHYFLQKLREDFPNEKLIGFFYDPNIHPFSEYKLRLLDVQRSCNLLNIDLIEGEYNYEDWLKSINYFELENEPEKSKRCELCFDKRLDESAKKAVEIGEKKFTTSLLISPLKSQNQLQKSGDELSQKYNLEFIFKDYRSNGGSEKQNILSKEDQLYRQDYCGCFLALNQQREQQNRFNDEVISDISQNRVLPNSIEEKIELYTKRIELEEQNIKYKIVKSSFLNYRLLFASLKIDKKVVNSYFLFYSIMPRSRDNFYKQKLKLDFVSQDILYLNRDSIKIVDLSYFNNFSEHKYLSVSDLIFNNQEQIKTEINIREKITQESFNTSIIVVIDDLNSITAKSKIEITLSEKNYISIREKILEL